jgi:serine protease Do
MKKIVILMIAICTAALLQAQKEVVIEERVLDSNPKVLEMPKSNKTITIRLNGNKINTEKMLVEIDGKNITINGKNISELKDVDVNINENKFLFKNGEFKMDLGKRPVQGRQWPQARVIEKYYEPKAILGIAMEKVDNGVKINEVNAESGAQKAGLKEGDIVTKINGKTIETEMDITRIVNDSKPGDVLNIEYISNGKKQNTKATLGERKATMAWSSDMQPGMPFEMPLVELENLQNLQNMDFDFKGNIDGMQVYGNGRNIGNKPKLGVTLIETEDEKGLEIKEIEEGGVAAKAGMQKGDIITTVNDNKVNTVGQIQQAVRNNAQKPLNITYLRNGKELKTSVKFPKKLKEVEM